MKIYALSKIAMNHYPISYHKPYDGYGLLCTIGIYMNSLYSISNEKYKCPLSRNNDVIYSYERHNLNEYVVNHNIKYNYYNESLTEIGDPYSITGTCGTPCRNKKGESIMLFKNKFDNVINTCEKSLWSYCKSTIKNHFGKDFEYLANRDFMIIKAITNKFLKKYDSNIYKRVTTTDYRGSHNVIINSQFIITLDKNTFIYVATGNKIGNVEERYMLNVDSPSPADLYLYIFGKNSRKYIKELNTLIHKLTINNDLGIYIIDSDKDSNNRETLDVIYSKLQPRFLETLFFSHGEKDSICKHIDKFNDNEKFYKEKQLLYKTGILLYGEPGTGKSSLVKAIATKYNRSIVTINMSKIKEIDLNKLTQSINVDEYKKYLILLEDIDTLFLNRKNGESDKEEQSVINKLLQFLDSNTSPTNVIFIATTNHIERLDDALLRDGRFDLKVEVKPLNRHEAILYGESFGLSKEVMNEILKDISSELNKHEGCFNQSKLQTRILGRIENKSVERIKDIYGEK